ncbi:acyltransferase [Aestuariicella hydrocarbonica]|uniref:Acyltransferase n=2 Tax=Pseudomaricurvus hydrocarbonicus TaxID=1470433 RepID=A0A9E5JXL7_9GAMM|nr:acyltransferase [Aestuariicella hydrocarbonica]
MSGLWNDFLVSHFFVKHFDCLGKHPMVVAPMSAEIFGRNIEVGDYLHLISSKDNPVRLTTWSGKGMDGKITVGSYCLMSPGTTITAADSIHIGDNCMFAAGCYIADSDWHGIYNRLRPFRCTKPIVLKDNVWIGHGAKVCKGVTIGENSVVAAGSVVVKDVPDNVVVGGNPAKVIKTINPKRRMLKRQRLFERGEFYAQNQKALDRYVLSGNTWWDWLRSMVFPTRQD